MARQARRISNTGLYHIIFRGVNHCNLFEEYKDYEKLLGILANVKSDLGYKIHAYCLMSNHVHLFVQEQSPADIVLIMKKVLGTYRRFITLWRATSFQSLTGKRKVMKNSDKRYAPRLVERSYALSMGYQSVRGT